MTSLRAHLKHISSLADIVCAKKLSAGRRKEIATKASHSRKLTKGIPLQKKPL